MIKERIKRLGCFVLAVCMIMCSQMPVMAKEIKMQGSINSMDCKAPEISSMVVKLSDGTKESLGNIYTTDSSSGAYIKKDKTKRAINTLAYYYSNATSDDDLMSHFKIVLEKSKYHLEADEVVDAPDAGMYEDIDKQDSYTNYYGFSKSGVKNDKLNYLKQIFSCTRFRRSDLRMYSEDGSIYSYLLSKNTSKDIYCYEDNNENSYVKVSDVIDGFDLKYESYSSSYYGGTINVSMTSNDKLIAGQIESTIVVRDDGSAIPVITNTKEELKKIVLDKNSVNEVYNQKFDNRNDIPDENCLKAGDILYKNVPYIISNYKMNKTEAQTWLHDKVSVYTSDFSGGSGSSMSFVDAKTRKEIDRASFYTSNSVIQTELFLQPKTYAVKSVEYDNGYYRVMLGCAHEDVTTTTEPVLDATCTTKGAYIEIKTCADCGEELSRETKYTNALGHNPGTPAKENEAKATCANGGSYQEVTRCTRCNEILSSVLKTTPAAGHKFGEWTAVDTVSQDVVDGAVNKDIFSGQSLPASLEKRTCSVCGAYEIRSAQSHVHSGYVMSKENIIDATCTKEGSYDVVTRCGTCNEEIARMHVVTDKKAHTPGQAVIENEVKATCTTDGSYDEVVKCTACGEELSRTAHTTKALGHVKGTSVKENVVNPACETEGSYDEVIYCERDENGCNHSKLSSTHVTVPATGHLHQATKIEKTKEPTCTEKGLYKSVIYCTDCNKVLDTKNIEIPATGHTAGEITVENNVDPTCTAGGSYDEVVRCTTCNDVISRNTVKVAALGHAAGEPVIENMVKPTEKKEGGYDVVIYCTRGEDGCGHSELSRKHVVLDKLEHKHTAGAPVIVHATEPTCTSGGTYYANIYCTDCGELLDYTVIDLPGLGHMYPQDEWIKVSSSHITKDFFDKAENAKELEKKTPFESIDKKHDSVYTVKCYRCDSYVVKVIKHVHTVGAPVMSETKKATCTEKGMITSTTSCTKCRKTLESTTIETPALEHIAGEPVIENKVDPTTKKEGGYDIVVYCTREHNGCGHKELSRKHIVLDKLKHEHTVGKPVVENKIDATCTKGGSYDVNVYCTDCNKLLNSTHETTEALGHEYSEPVIENKDGDKYDEVIYCARCGAELSRRTIDNSKKEPIVPDNKPEVKPETKPETKPEITPETKPETVNVVTPQDSETKMDDTVKTDNNNSADSTEEKTPVTGDTTDIMMYVYIIIAGAAAVTSAVIKKNKRA